MLKNLSVRNHQPLPSVEHGCIGVRVKICRYRWLTGEKWYQRSYRRHFFDMHVLDWNEKFWSRLNAREILENLLIENVASVAFMFLSHTGLAHYPSKVGQVHKAFQGNDILRDLIDQCHRKGYDVIMYYCLLYTDWYWETHPEARCVDLNGEHLRPVGLARRATLSQ